MIANRIRRLSSPKFKWCWCKQLFNLSLFLILIDKSQCFTCIFVSVRYKVNTRQNCTKSIYCLTMNILVMFTQFRPSKHESYKQKSKTFVLILDVNFCYLPHMKVYQRTVRKRWKIILSLLWYMTSRSFQVNFCIILHV